MEQFCLSLCMSTSTKKKKKKLAQTECQTSPFQIIFLFYSVIYLPVSSQPGIELSSAVLFPLDTACQSFFIFLGFLKFPCLKGILLWSQLRWTYLAKNGVRQAIFLLCHQLHMISFIC